MDPTSGRTALMLLGRLVERLKYSVSGERRSNSLILSRYDGGNVAEKQATGAFTLSCTRKSPSVAHAGRYAGLLSTAIPTVTMWWASSIFIATIWLAKVGSFMALAKRGTWPSWGCN